jgi:hypothetical protein
MFEVCPSCNGWGIIIRYLGDVTPYICDCPADAERGVKAYSSFGGTCQACGCPTNLLFDTGGRILTMACCQEHANQLDRISKERIKYGR